MGHESVLGKKYMVYFLKAPSSGIVDDSWLCGGALVSASQILTSAACLLEGEQMYAIAGYKKYIPSMNMDLDACTKQKKQKVIRIFVPEGFKLSSTDSAVWMALDVGVAIVEKPYDPSDMSYRITCSYEPRPVFINYEKRYEQPNIGVVAFGWGAAKGRNPDYIISNTNSKFLQEGRTVIATSETCEKLAKQQNMKNTIQQYLLCTSGAGHMDGEGAQIPGYQPALDGCARRRDLEGAENNDTNCPDEALLFRRKRNANITKDDVIGNQTIISNLNFTNTRRASSPGICQNDHGGPLIRWVGTREMIVGVALNSIYNTKYECVGPFLYVSTAKSADIVKCLVELDLEKRKRCNRHLERNDRAKEVIIDWEGRYKYLQPLLLQKKMNSYLRQGNEELPLQMRPTKDIEPLLDEAGNVQPNGQNEERGDNQAYDPQADQQQTQTQYDPPQDRPDVPMLAQENEQQRQEPQPQDQPYEQAYEQVYEQRQEKTNLNSDTLPQGEMQQSQAELYNEQQMESYKVQQMDPDIKPQAAAYPQEELYKLPQEEAYAPPKGESYDQVQMDSYKLPQMGSKQPPQMEQYKLPQEETLTLSQPESYNPSHPTYNQPRAGPNQQPSIEPYKQMNMQSQPMQYNDPQVDSFKFSQGETYNPMGNQPYNPMGNQPYNPMGNQPYKQSQIGSLKSPSEDLQLYNQPESSPFKLPIVEPYKPTIVDPFKPAIDNFKPAIEPYKPSNDHFQPAPVEPFGQSQLPQINQPPPPVGQLSIQAFEKPRAADALRERQREPEPEFESTFDLTRGEPQSFEQMFSQLREPVEAAKPAPEQTFEEMYKNLHDPSLELPHGEEFEQPSKQQFEQRYEQPYEQPYEEQGDQQFDQLSKQINEQTPVTPHNETGLTPNQPQDQPTGQKDDVKVRPQMPLDYQNDYFTITARRNSSIV